MESKKRENNRLTPSEHTGGEGGFGCPPRRGSEDFALVNAKQLAPGLLLVLFHGQPHCVLKHLLHAAVVHGRALQVALGTNLVRHLSPLRRCDTATLIGSDLAQIRLGGHQQHRRPGQEVTDLMDPLVVDAGERVGVGHREADQDHVRLLVGPGPDLLEVVAARRVPEAQIDLHPVHVDLHPGVLEHRGPVRFWEGLRSEADQQGGLADSAFADQNALH